MKIDSWLPISFHLPDGSIAGKVNFGGQDWQLIYIEGGGKALVVKKSLHEKWIDSKLIDNETMKQFKFAIFELYMLSSSPSQFLAPVLDCRSPNNKNEALSFSISLESTRKLDKESSLHDSIYVESINRLLPTYSASKSISDDIVLGSWLTGGVEISAASFSKISRVVNWMGDRSLKDVISASGVISKSLDDKDLLPIESDSNSSKNANKNSPLNAAIDSSVLFSLPGRPYLENFFNEHIIDIIRNKVRYATLGVNFPSALVLHGPPGCGKTFAVEKLIEFLGWPSFQIDSSSVGSPYIHETSRKVAEVFEKAINLAPSVLVIDEMESFLADRESGLGSSQHRVEEVAEFLRRIPEAVKSQVLIIAMTNRKEMIDPAILRRGRFDHIIEVGPASKEEVKALLDKLIEKLPKEKTIDTNLLSGKLAGRPLSDVSFVVREGSRLAARAGLSHVELGFFLEALDSTPSRNNESNNKIGFF